MQIIIVRHAEPNYAIDSLTHKGKKEARLLAKKLLKERADYYYCSPLGRAKKTASYTMRYLKKEPEIVPWLHEFKGKIKENKLPVQCWDRLPSDWTENEKYYTEQWHQTELMKELDVKKEYDEVCRGLDVLLKKHGYVHEGKHFKVENSNHNKIVLFCHFGVEAVILSHLFGISPMPLWHNFAALPSSVTTLVTEERQKGIAVFRMIGFGDTGHLYAGNEEPSFMARFCECFDDNTRH